MVVVSGQNLSLLASLLLSLSGLLKRKVVIILTFFVIAGYVILTGGQIPVLRAALMAYLSSLAQLLGRKSDGFVALIVVAALMLLINPNWIGDLSFQLSFLATFGVVVVAPILVNFFNKLPGLIRENLAVSVAAQVMVLPVISQNFHQLSLVSIPANLLTLWVIPYIMGGGIILLGLSAVSDALAQVFAFGLGVLLTYFTYIVNFFANFPYAWIYVGEQVFFVWSGYYMIVWGIMLLLSYDKKTPSGRP
jgi:competence protein ComEC